MKVVLQDSATGTAMDQFILCHGVIIMRKHYIITNSVLLVLISLVPILKDDINR